MPPFPLRTRKLVSPEGSACQSTNTTSARRWNSSHSGVSSIPPRAALKSFAFCLARELSVGDLRVFDCTTYLESPPPDSDDPYVAVPGRSSFETAHIPGADF